MTSWLKIGILLVYTAIMIGLGWHEKAIRVKADKAAWLQEQIDADTAKQKQVEQRAALAESALAAERQVTSSLNQKWSAARASKTHPDCRLSDAALGVLKDATDPVRHVSP